MAQMNIYIVDDNSDYRRSTAWWLQGLGYKVKDFSGGQPFLDWLSAGKEVDHGCLLLDVRMPEMSGLELHDRLKQGGREFPVIYMTGHADVPLAVEAMKKGAVTYLEKPLNSDALERAIDTAFVQQQVNQVESVAQSTSTIREDQGSPAKAAYARRFATLTPREKEVLDGVVKGKMNKVLASDLGISIKTIEIYRSQIKKKMKVKNIAELIAVVIREEVDV
jgi:two-component system response regulator FixJ